MIFKQENEFDKVIREMLSIFAINTYLGTKIVVNVDVNNHQSPSFNGDVTSVRPLMSGYM